MGLSRWRQRLRVLHALPRLAAGDTVTRAALALGYDTTSAFIAVFKRELGDTPARYARDARG
jgi:AraC-like DNA-binding protein